VATYPITPGGEHLVAIYIMIFVYIKMNESCFDYCYPF
jgi:hypothetical protein